MSVKLDYSSIIEQRKGELDLLKKQREQKKDVLVSDKKTQEIADKALVIVNNVLIQTQTKVKTFIEDVVSLALKVVFGNEYSFVIDFEIKRNKSEATPYIIKDDLKLSPKDEVGGGVIDVVAFGLRMALWAIAPTPPAPILILDEPGKYVSSDKQELFAKMIREVAEMFEVQTIIVSHSEDIINVADRSFMVTQRKSVSNVKEI